MPACVNCSAMAWAASLSLRYRPFGVWSVMGAPCSPASLSSALARPDPRVRLQLRVEVPADHRQGAHHPLGVPLHHRPDDLVYVHRVVDGLPDPHVLVPARAATLLNATKITGAGDVDLRRSGFRPGPSTAARTSGVMDLPAEQRRDPRRHLGDDAELRSWRSGAWAPSRRRSATRVIPCSAATPGTCTGSSLIGLLVRSCLGSASMALVGAI